MIQVKDKLQDRLPWRLNVVDDLWNGMFDFNGDGVTDIGEEYLAFRIFEAVTGESGDEEDDE